jgi:hypothetical protein
MPDTTAAVERGLTPIAADPLTVLLRRLASASGATDRVRRWAAKLVGGESAHGLPSLSTSPHAPGGDHEQRNEDA